MVHATLIHALIVPFAPHLEIGWLANLIHAVPNLGDWTAYGKS